MATNSDIHAWEIPGQRSLAGYSPWGRKELDITEQVTLSLFIQWEKNPKPQWRKIK